MALKQITKVAEEQSVQLYAGVGKFVFQAVNPSAAKIEELYGYKPEKEPEYITRDQSGKVTDIRLGFYGMLYNENGTVAVPHNFSLFLKRQVKENDPSKRDINGHKFLYIDRFGNTSWEVENHEKVTGRKFDYDNCHKAFDGEAELIDLMIAMNPEIDKQIWDYNEADKSYTLKAKDLSLGECYLERKEIEDIWKGNLKDLLDVLNSGCKVGTQIKLAVGTKDNSNYPVTYVRGFVSGKTTIANAAKRYKTLVANSCSSKEHYVFEQVKLIDSVNNITADSNNASDDLPTAPVATMNSKDDDDMPF